MDSPSPVEIAASVDVPDAVVRRKNMQNASGLDEAREQFINSVIGGNADNGNVKHVTRAAYPGQAKQVVASETGFLRIVDEVGSLDEPTAKLQPGPSSEEGRKSTINDDAKGKTEIGQREVSNSRFQIFDAEITEVDLGLRTDHEVIVKIQSGSSNSSGLALKEGLTIGGAKSKIEQRLDSKIKTEITDIDLGLPDDRKVIVKVQPGFSSELVPKQARKSSTESLAKDKTSIEQREISDLRSKMEIVDVNLSLNDSHEIMNVHSSHSSSGELRLGECCWPTRENTANDKIDVCDRKVISETEIIDVQLGLDQKSTLAPKEKRRSIEAISNEISSDQFSFGKAASISSGLNVKSIGKEKIDKEVNIKKEIINVELDADGVVKIQPANSNRGIIALNENRKRSKDNLEPIKINDTEQAKLSSEGIMKDNIEIDDTEVNSKEETSNFELDKVRHLEVKTTTLSPPLDGRHACALSDFGVDKEDYRLTQYGSDKNEKDEEKSTYTARSKLSKHADERDDTLDDVDDFVNDSEISSKKSDAQLYKSQVLVSAMIHKSHEEESECFTEEIDNRAEYSEELNRSKFIVERLPLEPDSEIILSGERTERESTLDQRSLWTTSCDLSLEIDGKYLKSIVNSRKSPKKIREDQICDVEIKKQHRIANDQQSFQSEAIQSSFMKTKSSEKIKKEEICDIDADIEKKDQTANDRETSRTEKVFQGSSRSTSMKVKGSRKVKELQADGSEREFKNQDGSINDREVFRAEKVFQSSSRPISRPTSMKTKSSRKVEELYDFKNQDKSISDQETSRSEKISHRSSRTSASAKSPKKVKKSQILYRSEMKDYDRSVNDRVISQLEEVFQDTSKKFTVKTGSPKKSSENIESKKQNRPADNRETFRSLDEPSQHSSRTSSMKSPKKIQDQKTVRLNDNKAQGKEATKTAKNADNRTTKCDFNEIKDVYTRKVRRYNMPLQGSLDSMIASEESSTQKPKKDDAFSKKSKSYESIKRIQEVFLGVPSSKANSSASQLDIPDEFCSICYMNDMTFRTEEEVSSPNQETFYTLRSTCSSLADDDESIECDICGTLNMQESADDLENKVEEIPCELCRICGEVDGSYDQDSALCADRYGFKVVEPHRDDDDSFEIENCGLQSGTESADDRGKITGKEKDSGRPKSQSLFIHGSSTTRDQPRELYFIPKDEIAILTCGTRKVSRKGSLFRKKEDFNRSVRDNRRYSSVDSLQLAKMSPKASDKALKISKKATLIGSADNLQISDDSTKSKSLQRSIDGRLNVSSDDLNLPAKSMGKENEAEESSQKPNTRDKEEVKMILTQHGIKIISEKETAL